MNSSKKLIYIANLRLPTEKAYGIQIAKMCEAFAGFGFDVELVAPYRISKIKGDFFDYYSIKKSFKFTKLFSPDIYLLGKLNLIALGVKNFISALILMFYVLGQKSDIIYSRDEFSLFLLSFFRKNLIYEAHRFSNSRGLFYRRFKNRNLKVVVITKRLKDDFIKIGFSPENILVAPDGVDLEEFDVGISKEEAQTRVDLPLDRKIVMYTGHLFEWKGAGVLLETARQCPGLLFVFVGGTDHDVKQFKEKARGIDNVLILGHKPHKDVPVYLKAADVLVLPNSAKEEISRAHTSPLKLFEYMASKRPIVASSLPSIREVLNESNSILVKPDITEALAGGILRLLDNPDMTNQLAERAFQDVQEYSWQNRAKKILNFVK